MNAEISKLLKNLKVSGNLQLNIDKPSLQCRELYENLLKEQDWKNVYSSKVNSIELPMEEYTYDEENILRSFLELSNLKFCRMIGGRCAKDELRWRGGLISLPIDKIFPECIEIIDLSFNKLTAVPRCFKHLHNLKVLMLDFNNIEELSFEFWEKENSCNIIELYLRNNLLVKIDRSFCHLSKLQVAHLSSNKLVQVPDCFHMNSSLLHLDLSNNNIEILPDSLFCSSTLQKLVASHNKLIHLPSNIVSSGLKTIDVRYNHIVDVAEEIKCDPRVMLYGNTPLFVIVPSEIDDYNVKTTKLMNDVIEIEVNSLEGAKYVLPSGVKIVVPNNFSCDVEKIHCNVISKEPTSFQVKPTDQLLSVIVELTPNGLILPKSMRLSLPFSYSSYDQQIREIIMRVTSVSTDGKISFEDLQSETSIENEDDSRLFGEVTVFVKHFSLFGVISRLKVDSIMLDENNPGTLFSTVDEITRLHFPEKSVLTPTNVTIQMLVVNEEDVKSIVKSGYCPASNVLHVSVNPSGTDFSFPITIHLALPKSLIGRPYDHKMLRLMKCHAGSDDWHDITDDVVLVFSTIDVSFQVNSFSNFMVIWKEFKGVVRKIYRRLITYNVQFIAMQKKALPHIILTQCIRTELVDQRIKQLLDEGYCNNDSSSEVHELMEGDKFKIKVIGDLKLKDEFKSHLEEFGLIRQFHSQYPPERTGYKFPIEPVSPTPTVTGYISFYKVLETLLNSPESDCNISSTDSIQIESNCVAPRLQKEFSYLDDILITLERTDTKLQLPDDVDYPLRFGDYANGMFDEATLCVIASQIGSEWEEIGHYLGIRSADMERIKLDNPKQTKQQIFLMLQKWSRIHMHEANAVTEFSDALKKADRTDLSEQVLKIYNKGVENFKSDIKRAKGLPQPESF